MVDLGTCVFKYLNIWKITPEESSKLAYVEELYESQHVRTSTKQFCVILYAKYKNPDIHTVM